MDGPNDTERRQIAQLLWGISQRFGDKQRGWDNMVTELGISSTTAKPWKPTGAKAKPPSVPNGYYLALILRLAGILTEDFQVPTLEAALRAAEASGEAALRLPPRTQGGQGTAA